MPHREGKFQISIPNMFAFQMNVPSASFQYCNLKVLRTSFTGKSIFSKNHNSVEEKYSDAIFLHILHLKDPLPSPVALTDW